MNLTAQIVTPQWISIYPMIRWSGNIEDHVRFKNLPEIIVLSIHEYDDNSVAGFWRKLHNLQSATKRLKMYSGTGAKMEDLSQAVIELRLSRKSWQDLNVDIISNLCFMTAVIKMKSNYVAPLVSVEKHEVLHLHEIIVQPNNSVQCFS